MREREQAQQIAELQAAVHEREEQVARNLESEITALCHALSAEILKARQSWKINCEHLTEQDTIITEREEEVKDLKRKLAELSRWIGSGGKRRETLPMSTPPHSVRGYIRDGPI